MNLRLSDNETIRKLRTPAIEQALTPRLEKILMSAEDPAELNELMLKHEKEMAENRNKYFNGKFYCEYLVCDEAVEIMSYILKKKGITHEIIMGFNEYGDTHVWIRVDGVSYDPTDQGQHEGQIIYRWNNRTGESEDFKYIDVDFDDEELYWSKVVVP
jgi:hypothetical protein